MYLEDEPVRELAGAQSEHRLEVSAQDLLVGALADRLDDRLVHRLLVGLALL